jgi:DNA-binding transcriptional regulator YhcF (GntR family)
MITIDTASPIPLEEQIAHEIRHAIARNEVNPADPLPSARQLAADLQVHWNTVARAYKRLQADGLVTVNRGRGVYVRALPQRGAAVDSPKRARVMESIRTALTEGRLAGFSVDEMRELIGQEIAAWDNRKERRQRT